MLKSLQMISMNQIAAQVKLTEMWKASMTRKDNRFWLFYKFLKEFYGFIYQTLERSPRGNFKSDTSAKKINKAYCKTLPI